MAQYLFDHVMAVPSQISLHVRDGGEGVEGIRSVTRLVRLGRTLVVTDGEVHDAANPARLIAFGSIMWSVIGEAPTRTGSDGGDAAVPTAHEPTGFDVVDAAGIRPLDDGRGCQLDGITPATTGPGGILHAGLLQLLSEEAALVAAQGALGEVTLRATDCSYHFMQPGKIGPFFARAEVLHVGPRGADLRVTVTDEGNGWRSLVLSFVHVAAVP